MMAVRDLAARDLVWVVCAGGWRVEEGRVCWGCGGRGCVDRGLGVRVCAVCEGEGYIAPAEGVG